VETGFIPSLDENISAVELHLSTLGINVKAVCANVKSVCASCTNDDVVQFIKKLQKILEDVNKDDVKSLLLKGIELTVIMNTAIESVDTEYISILRLPACFLQWLWSNRDRYVLPHINFALVDSQIREDHAGILKQFESSEDYLEGLENHLDRTRDQHVDTTMIDWINLNDGSTFLAKVQITIGELMQTNDIKKVPRLVELIKLYVSITFLKSTIMLRVCCIAQTMDSKSLIVSGIKNVINKEQQSDRKFFKCFEQPTYNRAVFFACFNPSENDLIVSFAKSRGVQFQSLRDELDGKHFALRPQKWPMYWAIMSCNPWGTIWSTQSPYDRKSLYFDFQSVSEKDNYFLVKSFQWKTWYMFMKDTASLRGKEGKPGADGEWKIIKFEDGRYMMCTREWPGKFAYMKDAMLGEVVAGYGDRGKAGHWIFEK
ncbi:Hypothetical predicted protein, partial [Mytilus galloprovincialis]